MLRRKESLEKTDAGLPRRNGGHPKIFKAVQEETKTAVETGLEELKATDMKVNPEEIEVVEERQNVPNE
jgi:hypothetical protein